MTYWANERYKLEIGCGTEAEDSRTHNYFVLYTVFFQAWVKRFSCQGTGKQAWAKDLDLDKIGVSKYSLDLGGVVQRRGKVTEKWRH